MKSKTLFLLTSLLIYLSLGCKKDNPLFKLKGREVLFSLKVDQKSKLFLLNIDTGKQIEIDYFDDIGRTSFQIYNNGESIFADPHNSSFFIKYEILENDGKIIAHNEQSELTLDYFDFCIFKDTLYAIFGSKIVSYSLFDSRVIREYNTDSNIFDFEVISGNKFAVIHSYYDFEKKSLVFSNVILYNFTDKINKDTLSYDGMRIKSSKSGKSLYFSVGKKQYLYTISSSSVKELVGLNQDSLLVYGQSYFIDENTLVFVGQKNGDNNNYRDLYLYDLKLDKILRQLTKGGTVIDIKSTFYRL